MNRPAKWLKAVSKTKAIYRIYHPLFCDSLTFGSNAFRSLLARRVIAF